MNMVKRRDAGLAYVSDEKVMEEQAAARKILQKLNFMDRSDFEGIAGVVKELLGKSENAMINPPFTAIMEAISKSGKTFCKLQLHNSGCGEGENRRQLPDGA